MIRNMDEIKKDAIMTTADMMVAAALTAPKGSGKDTIRTAIITGEDKDRLRDKMLKLGEQTGQAIFSRDAGNVDNSVAVVLIGCTGTYFGLGMCGMCGFENCGACRNAGARCVFTVTDLGIAVGSAVSVAADHRIDNRVMYSVGRAALKAGMMPDDVAICYGIPLSISSKSIFFDRGPGAVINTDSE